MKFRAENALHICKISAGLVVNIFYGVSQFQLFYSYVILPLQDSILSFAVTWQKLSQYYCFVGTIK